MLLPPLTDVLAMLVQLLGRSQVQEAILVTAAEVIVAFIIAVPLGAAIGVLSAETTTSAQIFKPLLFYVFSVPKSIFLPMFILDHSASASSRRSPTRRSPPCSSSS